jgi:hypothetical protein
VPKNLEEKDLSQHHRTLAKQAPIHQTLSVDTFRFQLQAEYKEFLALGHGDIFDLDVVRTVVIDKTGELRAPPWHFPGCDLSDYFNYGMDPESWRYYCAIIEAYRCVS